MALVIIIAFIAFSGISTNVEYKNVDKVALAEESWVPADSSNFSSTVAPLTQSTSSNCGLYFNKANVLNIETQRLDRYLDYFITPYQETSTIITYFQEFGYVYGKLVDSAIPTNSTIIGSSGGSYQYYCYNVGLRAQYRLDTTTNEFKLAFIDISNIYNLTSTTYSAGNIRLLDSRVSTNASTTSDWRLSQNFYSIAPEGSFTELTLGLVGSWGKYPTMYRHVGDGKNYLSQMSIEGYCVDYDLLPERYQAIAPAPFNGFGASATTEVLNDLRTYLSDYIGFGTVDSVNVYGDYNSGYTAGYDVGKQEGYDEGWDEGSDTYYQIGKDEGYDSGYDEGYDSGYDEGYDSGYDEGYDSGYDEGVKYADSRVNITSESWTDGYNIGFSMGEDEGYDSGYDEGVLVSYDVGYEAGRGAGYSVGYAEGLAVAETVDGSSLGALGGAISGTTDIFVNAFDTLSGIEVFGITLGSILALAVAIAIVVFIIKMVKR